MFRGEYMSKDRINERAHLFWGKPSVPGLALLWSIGEGPGEHPFRLRTRDMTAKKSLNLAVGE